MRARLTVPLLLATLAPATAQHTTAGTLRYPEDQDRVVARVGGRDLTLEDVVRHLDERHAPGFSKHLALPEGDRYFSEQRFGADWVRQFADLTALREVARERGLDLAAAEPVLSAALKREFEASLAQRKLDPAQLSPEVLAIHLARFQQEHGMQAEVQGWLDFLVPEEATDEELRRYFAAHARFFGGKLTFAHILIAHRDPQTLHLLDGEARAKALAKAAEVEQLLKAEGADFEDLAARYSDDRRTATRGGVFRHVDRFDARLPAVLCRTAWGLAEDGDVTGPVESPYGLHFVKRVSMVQVKFMVLIPKVMPLVGETMRKHRQEDLLFGAREKLGVELLY